MTELDHRAVIAGLSDTERRFLTEKADMPGLLRFGVQAGAAAVLAVLIVLGVPFWPLLMLPLGLLIVFWFTLEHEAIHGTAFRSEFLDVAASHIAGLLLVVPPTWFRYFHFAHHRHTNDPDSDPELMSPRPRTPGEYLIYLSGWRYWSGMIGIVLEAALFGRTGTYVPTKGRPKVIREARLYLAAYALLFAGSAAAGSAVLVWIWLAPVLLGQPFLRAYLLAEHMYCPPVANMLENTRTTFTNRIVRFLAWNMPYHAEHHAYPAVPFHRLPQFHLVVAKHLRTTENGYLRFHGRVARDLAGQNRRSPPDQV